MASDTLVSLLVVVVAFALFFWCSFRGVNLFLTVFACTFLVTLCTPDGVSAIFTSFLPSTGNMFQQFFLLYTIGGAFGYCLMESGLGSAIAIHLIKVFGEKWIAVVLFVITCLMMAGGVASYQYAILAIALPVLKRANLPRKVALAAMSAGAGSVVYGTLVGMPTALNIAPTTYLGTTTMAGPVVSLVCSAFSTAFIVLYLVLLTRRCKRKGEGFLAHPNDAAVQQDETRLPPAWKGYLCIAAVVGLSLLFQFMGITALQATVYAQVLSIVLLFFLTGRGFLAHPLETCVRGIQGSTTPVIFISIIVGYGSVVQQTPIFNWLVERVLSLDMHPYLLTFVAVNLLAGMTANGTGGVTLFMKTFGETFLHNPTIDLGVLHRIAAISGSGFDSLPHNGAISFQLSVFNMSYREGYFQQFICSVLVNLLAGVLALSIGLLFY